MDQRQDELSAVARVVCSEAPKLICSQPRNISTRSRDMDTVEGAAVSPEVPQELLEEMIWVFRVEDGK